MAVWPLLLVLLAQEAPRIEKVRIPDTKASFELVRLSEGPLKPVWIGRREVTWKEFLRYYDEDRLQLDADSVTRPSRGMPYMAQVGIPRSFELPDRPAPYLRWHSAIGYCDWLSRKTGHYYRLPTEAEWGAACRAGRKGAAPPDGEAWHAGNSKGALNRTGALKANPFGIYDMLGNVWEYCLEQESGAEFAPVLRGGAYVTPFSELGYETRRGVTKEWFESDPCRPRSTWWLTDEFSQGLRVVRVGNSSVEGVKQVYSGKIRVTLGAPAEPRWEREKGAYLVRIRGEIENVGQRSLDEVELQVHPLGAKGERRLVDGRQRALFNKCWPVLVNSGRKGAHQAPLPPGGKRKWALDLPASWDDEDFVVPGRFGARVTAVRFSAKD